MTDKYVIERRVGIHGSEKGYWQSISSEVRVKKNEKTILHLGPVQKIRPEKMIEHEEFKDV